LAIADALVNVPRSKQSIVASTLSSKHPKASAVMMIDINQP